jgi:hypothetical protein
MSKFLIFAFLFAAASLAFSEVNLWNQYKSSRTKAYEAFEKLKFGNSDISVYQEAVASFASASTTAAALGRRDIVAWNLNNSAYAGILFFKARVDYDRTMNKIKSMQPGVEKKKAIKEFKAKCAEVFPIIEAHATFALAQAGTIGGGDEELEHVVNSNKKFLAYVSKFIESK